MEHLSLDQFDTAPQTTEPWKIASISKNKSKKKDVFCEDDHIRNTLM